MIIYPDSCIYGRQRDDQTQPDIKAETMAIGGIIRICKMAGHIFIGSVHVENEILANSDIESRKITLALYDSIAPFDIDLTTAVFRRAREFEARGLGEGDSIHLAVAESANADILLTVDKDFERIATNKNLSKVRVLNPFNLLQEVTQ